MQRNLANHAWPDGAALRVRIGLHSTAAQVSEQAAPEIVRRVPVDSGPQRLLDVGGGHGRYTRLASPSGARSRWSEWSDA